MTLRRNGISAAGYRRITLLALLALIFIIITGRGGAPHRLGAGLLGLAHLRGEPVRPRRGVPRPGGVREPGHHRRGVRGRGARRPRCAAATTPAAGPDLAGVRARGRGCRPGGARGPGGVVPPLPVAGDRPFPAVHGAGGQRGRAAPPRRSSRRGSGRHRRAGAPGGPPDAPAGGPGGPGHRERHVADRGRPPRR